MSEFEPTATDPVFEAAYEAAQKSLREGGIPIGAALARDGLVIASGHNERVQHGDPIAHGEMSALRAAHFLRMTTGANGDVLGAQAITQNIARMEFTNRSVIDALYSRAEWSQVKQFAHALEPMLPPANFARTSGSGERVTRMLAQRAAGQAPLIGWLVRGVENVRTAVQANRAVSGPIRPPLKPNPGVTATAAGFSEQPARSRPRHY